MQAIAQISTNFFTLASILMMKHHDMDYSEELVRSRWDHKGDTFDFIVVGASPSGCILTTRLVNSGFSVLLLESGGETHPLLQVPVMLGPFENSVHSNYNYFTTPQKFSNAGMNGRQTLWAAGKALGGSSVFNGLLWTRGHKNEYDNWANITKDPSWNYENLEQYFQKPLEEVRTVKEPTELGSIFIKAGEQLGFKNPKDDDTFEQEGFHDVNFFKKDGRRFSIYELFVQPLLGNPLLTIRKFSTVSKILLKDKEAYGVEYLRFGRMFIAKAGKEVLVSAGAVQSPKLLMLSGIGPKEHLQEFQIPVHLDLPVGLNLQDHFSSMMPSIITPRQLTYRSEFETLNAGQTILNFLSKRGGSLATTGYGSMAYVTSSTAKNRGEDYPDVELVLSTVALSQGAYVRVLEGWFNMKEGILDSSFSPAYNKNSFTIGPRLGRPKSRGRITLASTNPMDKPKIDPKYLSHPDDLNALIESMELIRRLLNETEAFKSIGVQLPQKPLEACDHFEMYTTEYSECILRTVGVPGWDPVGTCKMGFGPEDPEAVVDSQLQVIGAKRLRVVDASVFPVITRSSPLWATLMISEKISDVIIKKYLEKML